MEGRVTPLVDLPKHQPTEYSHLATYSRPYGKAQRGRVAYTDAESSPRIQRPFFDETQAAWVESPLSRHVPTMFLLN